jgi:hypothetical protein
LREFGHRPSRGEAILVHNPELHRLVLKRGHRTKTVREQRTRNRSTRPYFDTLVTFLWYDLLISGGLRSVGWGTSLPRVTTLSFPPLFRVCNTLFLSGGARNTRSRPWRGAMFTPVRWAGCRKVEPQSHPPAARWLTQGEPNVRHEPVDSSADRAHTSPPLTGR